MQKILVSACLLGEAVRYDGRDNLLHDALMGLWREQGRLVPLCPEVAGGLGVPRAPVEIIRLEPLELLTRDGADVTAAFRRGAEAALDLVHTHAIRIAILKEGSPSCASSSIYDGSFSRRKLSGQGVTTVLLRAHGVAVFSEHELARVAAALAALEYPR